MIRNASPRYIDCGTGGRRPYQYSQCCKKVSDCAPSNGAAVRIAHKLGGTMFGDWVGWTYEECVPDMKFRSWMSAHVRMFQAAGGTPTSSFPTAVSPRQFLLGIVVSSVCRAGLYGPPRGPSPPYSRNMLRCPVFGCVSLKLDIKEYFGGLSFCASV